jgi:hypothetical protein
MQGLSAHNWDYQAQVPLVYKAVVLLMVLAKFGWMMWLALVLRTGSLSVETEV